AFDLAVPPAPAAVRIGGRPTLVYELHLTNFSREDLVLTGLEILTGPPGGSRRLAQYRGSDLAALIGRAGAVPAPEVTRIGPGVHAVAYLWLPFERADAVPAELTHRVEFISREGAGPVSSAEGGAA